MSHQAGIHANDELRTFFGNCKDGSVRLFKVVIKDEQLILHSHHSPKGSWEDDFDFYVLASIDNCQPCFIFYRLDTKNDSGFEWLFITWSPEDAVIREKMLCASTKATLKMEFGGGQIKHELFASQIDEVCLKSYMRNQNNDRNPLPRTYSEEILEEIRKNEAVADVESNSMLQTMQGLTLPISDDAINAICDIKDGQLNYLQLSIDTVNEKVNLEFKGKTDVHSLSSKVPKDHARYHLFKFCHSYEGDFLESMVFIYSMPGYNCSVKERMIYSSCKSSLLNVIENKIGIDILKKIEIDDADELTEAFLIDELHPKKNIYKPKFSKPKGPQNRGAKRLLKSEPLNSN